MPQTTTVNYIIVSIVKLQEMSNKHINAPTKILTMKTERWCVTDQRVFTGENNSKLKRTISKFISKKKGIKIQLQNVYKPIYTKIMHCIEM